MLELWNYIHMDHADINGVEHLLILVNWPEVICVPDKRSGTEKKINSVILLKWSTKNPGI